MWLHPHSFLLHKNKTKQTNNQAKNNKQADSKS